MKHIEIIAGILIAGAHVEVGTVLTVGADIDRADAELLVRLGRAVEADEPPVEALADLTVAELKALAKAEGIALGEAKTPAEIAAVIEVARKPAE